MFNVLDKRDGIVSASQQAIFNKISTNNADGYIDGYLNSFRIIKATSSTISIDSGILSIQGYRVYNNDLFTHTVIFNTSKDLDFQLVAVFNHFVSSEKDNIEIVSRPVQALRKDNLFANADAVYEVELAEFTLTSAGIADDFVVTLEKVVYNEQDLSELLDKVATAEENSSFAVEKVNELEKKIVDKQGTAVSVGGEIVTDLSFESDPQAQIDGKADKTTTEEAIENLNKAVEKKADNDDFIIAISSLESSVNKKEPAFSKNTAFNKNFGTGAGTVCEGNDSRLSNARPASDVYAWAKAQNKPTYTKSEVGLGNVDNVRQYSAQNPPPYPVTSVGGKTGAVSLSDLHVLFTNPANLTPNVENGWSLGAPSAKITPGFWLIKIMGADYGQPGNSKIALVFYDGTDNSVGIDIPSEDRMKTFRACYTSPGWYWYTMQNGTPVGWSNGKIWLKKVLQ